MNSKKDALLKIIMFIAETEETDIKALKIDILALCLDELEGLK